MDSLSQSYRYDAGGQVTGQTDYFGNLTTTVYDADGEVSVTIDGLGQRTTMLYDGAGRVTTTIDALTHRTTSVYDADSRQTTLVDADGNSTIFIYDAVGNVTQQTEPNGHSATFAYDAANQLTATTDADGRLMTFSYDGDGRELGETWYTGSTALSTMINNIVTYTYDNVGNLSTAANYNGVYTMAYDNDNEMTLVHEPVGATLTMVYDGVGNRTEVDDSFGGTENSTYDALNRLINRSYTYGVTVQAHIEEAYDALNEVTQVKRDGAGSPGTPVSTTNYTYDDAGRITNIHDTIAGSGSNIANYTYTYDAAGNMQTEVLTRTTFTAVTTTYAYDADNQLTGDGTTTVTYDATGNRNNGSYATTTGNELTTDGVWTYTYDNAGNEIGKSNATDTWVYTYNNRNQLVEADRDATGTSTVDLAVAYKYDAFGNQIEEDVTQSGTTTTTKYVMDGWDPALAGTTGNSKWNVAADVTGGSLTTRYLRGDAVDQLLAELAFNGTSFTPDWTLTDIRGSVRSVIDNSGTVLDAINYGAFGNIITSGAQAETNSADRGRYAWTGQELDVQTGLQYNRARWYDSNTGRWITQDPLGFDAGDSNLYRYVNNRPTVEVDPSGQKPEFLVSSITINDQGKSFFKGNQLGPYGAKDGAAFAFEVKIEGVCKNGGTIANMTYSQKLFISTTRQRVDGKWFYDVNRKIADEKAYNNAVDNWKANPAGWWTANTIADAPAKGDYLKTGTDYVQWVDAPGWPGLGWGPNEPQLSANIFKKYEERVAIWVKATGTDQITKEAWFYRYLTFTSVKDVWKVDGPPVGSPELPKTFK